MTLFPEPKLSEAKPTGTQVDSNQETAKAEMLSPFFVILFHCLISWPFLSLFME
jgi:hypothetical protein